MLSSCRNKPLPTLLCYAIYASLNFQLFLSLPPQTPSHSFPLICLTTKHDSITLLASHSEKHSLNHYYFPNPTFSLKKKKSLCMQWQTQKIRLLLKTQANKALPTTSTKTREDAPVFVTASLTREVQKSSFNLCIFENSRKFLSHESV